jgi:hypothetical protein
MAPSAAAWIPPLEPMLAGISMVIAGWERWNPWASTLTMGRLVPEPAKMSGAPWVGLATAGPARAKSAKLWAKIVPTRQMRLRRPGQ